MPHAPTLRTRRLRLRPHAFADVQALAREADSRRVAAEIANLRFPFGELDAQLRIAGALRDPDASASYRWVIADGTTDRVLGELSLHVVDAAAARGELAYWLGERHWGQGLATEAVRAAVAFARADVHLHILLADTQASNPASGRVLQKCGFARVASDSLRETWRLELTPRLPTALPVAELR